ncbi:TetR/AcrR family transcriptional regulator [Nonomuraea sp. M3C6]|uniref:TetR/AcrR family transcriptional regulator n=1 Tax=Nonomuraea marmarensis TaxID=3351344 RepID=A0ABW7ANT1_9ACTN
MDSPEDDEREPILRAATRLFAALGYDSTSCVQVGEAAGVDMATVSTYFPTKRELYLAVMEEAHRIRTDVLLPRAGELRAAPPEGKAAALNRFIDGYLDLCLEYPEIPSLWMHRWLSDARDIGLDAIESQRLIYKAIDSVATVAEPAGADAKFTTYTMIWCIHGFALSGGMDTTGQHLGTGDPEALQRFRDHMHQMLGRATGLSEVAGGR